MRDDVYKNIMRILRSVIQDSVPHSRKFMEILQKAYPTIPELTLESIYTLYYQRRMRIRHFKCKEMAEELYHRYNCAVANGESRILLCMSLEFDLAPALLARLILDQHFLSEDKNFNKCKSTVFVRNPKPSSKLPNVSEESSASHSVSERTKSSENTVSEVSEDISLEECSEASKISDDVLPPDAESVVPKVAHRDNITLPAERQHSLPPTSHNGTLKPQKAEIVQESGHVKDESTVHLKSRDVPNDRLVNTDHVSGIPNGCPNTSVKRTDAAEQVTEHRGVQSSKLEESASVTKKTGAWGKSQTLQNTPSVDKKTKCEDTEKVAWDVKGRISSESTQITESCNNHKKDKSKAITTKKQVSCSNGVIEVSQKMEESFREELQELKNKLIQLKLDTKKMLATNRRTASDEAGIEISGMKRSISRLMKDTTLIQDKTLANEVSMCVLYDDQYGPAATTYKHSLGQEYEVKLIKHANAADLTFHLEARLRERGFDKTPDLLLIYPIAIGCNVVNWIESKALFADREVHSMYFVHQYERYCSRYGPGLVIYWFGFVESLREDDPSILVRDNFPKYIKHMNLLVDDASDVEADEENGALPEWEVAEPPSEEMTKFLERFSN